MNNNSQTKQQIFWHTTVTMPDDAVLAPLPQKVDVAIIGGGFTGLSAARTLAKAGTSVAVLEANSAGWGASSRNGGMVLTGLKVGMSTVMQRYGRDLARKLFQYSLDSVSAVETIVREEGIECGFARRGHLLVANKPKQYEAMQASAEFHAREFDHHVELVPPQKLREEIGSNMYYGGTVDAVSGGLNPAQYVTGLSAAAQKAGALICARARVQKLERRGPRFFIQTERGALEADSVLVATSGYTGGVTGNLRRRIIPIGSFIIATEKLSPEVAHELSPRQRMIFDYRHYLNYFRLWDDRMIFGGRAAFFPENQRTIARSAEILRRELVQVYPQLQNTRVEFAWGGTLDFAFDMMTHVGELDGLYYSLGYAGHGVAMATLSGKTVAEAILKGNIREHPLAQFDFRGAPLGLYDGRPWFLPFAGAWYKILDFVE